ncbi:MAG: hypothetical protein Q9201_001746 [Fulgogasparrea decipioides]
MFTLLILRVFSLITFLIPIIHSQLSVLDTTAHTEKDIGVTSFPSRGNGGWLGWGANIYNNRWAFSGAKVDASNIASLNPTCKIGYSVGVSAAPLVANGISYYPTWGGLFVALDYTKCQVLWQVNITDIVVRYKPVPKSILSAGILPVSRTTPAIDGNVLYLGTSANALLLAVDKRNGKVIDTIQINDHPAAIVTMSPTVWRGSIFIGGSSLEEGAADAIPGYKCCSFIGNMRAITFVNSRFRLLWNQNMIPSGLNFSGAAIWGSQPSIDPTRNQVFVATGNVYSVPPSYTACQNSTTNQASAAPDNATDPCAPPGLFQEAVLAFDTATGHINWVHTLSPLDAWNVACSSGPHINPGACPPNPGPDADFGMAPSFVPGSEETPFNEDTIVVGQKNGNLYALSAEAGKNFWALATSPDGLEGGLIWGVAVDASAVYYTAVNTVRKPWQLQDGTSLSNSAFGAASLSTGEILWETPVPRNETTLVAPTVADDLVLTGSGGLSADVFGPRGLGSLIALNKRTGDIIRDSTLDQYFQGGIAVVDDYVMFGTGYNGGANGTFNVWKLNN